MSKPLIKPVCMLLSAAAVLMACEAGGDAGNTGGADQMDCFAYVYLDLYSDERQGNAPAAEIDARRDELIKQFNARMAGRDFSRQMRRLIARVEEISATEPSPSEISARAQACGPVSEI